MAVFIPKCPNYILNKGNPYETMDVELTCCFRYLPAGVEVGQEDTVHQGCLPQSTLPCGYIIGLYFGVASVKDKNGTFKIAGTKTNRSATLSK